MKNNKTAASLIKKLEKLGIDSKKSDAWFNEKSKVEVKHLNTFLMEAVGRGFVADVDLIKEKINTEERDRIPDTCFEDISNVESIGH